jgi:hypothetical protein
MLRRSFWRACTAGAVVVALRTGSAAAQSTAESREQVHVTYDAPPSCPTAEAFLSQVRVRVGTDWEAPLDVLAHTIEVRVSGAEPHLVARIDFVDEHGQKFTRAVSATTCDEVVSGIALITALAIESRVAEALNQSEPAATDAPPATEAAPSPPPQAPRTVTGTPRPEEPERPHSHPSSPRSTHFDFGAAGLIGSGVGPALGRGFRGFIGLGWKRGPDIRLGVDYLSTPLITSNGVPTLFSLFGSRASGCPVAIPLGTLVRVLPCAGTAIGAHRGEGRGLNHLVKPGESAPIFFTPFASLRAEIASDAFFVEVEGEAKFPVDHHRFQFDTKPTTEHVYSVPWVAFGLSAGLGLRL